MISESEILMGRQAQYPLSDELKANLAKLMAAVNKLRTLYGKPMYVSSGYRPGRFNVAAHGAKNSAHEVCEAVDFHDRDGDLKAWITEDILAQCGLYQESPKSTPTWLHVQVRPTKERIFIP